MASPSDYNAGSNLSKKMTYSEVSGHHDQDDDGKKKKKKYPEVASMKRSSVGMYGG